VGASVNLAGYLGLVGRDTELRQLAAALEASVETGAESTLLVRGEAGIGEARLSEAAAELAAARGFRTHRSRLVDAGGQVAGAIPALLIRELLGLTQGEDEWRTRAAVKAASADPDLSLFLCVSEGSAHRAEAGLFLALLQREMGEIAAACRVLESVIAGCGDEQVFCDAHIELAGALLVQTVMRRPSRTWTQRRIPPRRWATTRVSPDPTTIAAWKSRHVRRVWRFRGTG
jgi:hypothetical protein